jgi:hypothetical protein
MVERTKAELLERDFGSYPNGEKNFEMVCEYVCVREFESVCECMREGVREFESVCVRECERVCERVFEIECV